MLDSGSIWYSTIRNNRTVSLTAVNHSFTNLNQIVNHNNAIVFILYFFVQIRKKNNSGYGILLTDTHWYAQGYIIEIAWNLFELLEQPFYKKKSFQKRPMEYRKLKSWLPGVAIKRIFPLVLERLIATEELRNVWTRNSRIESCKIWS